MQTDVVERVRLLAKQISEREGCLLYDLEFTGGQQGRVLRVFIDRFDGQVSIDDCANVSRGLNVILDEQDVIPGGAYDLEVSSPGLERKLTQRWHFARAVGQPVRIKTSEPVTGGVTGVTPQTLLDGTLMRVEGETVVLDKDGHEWIVSLAQVAKANVRFETPQSGMKKGKKR
jgi:ribosome maturation factor RimP